LLVEETGSTVKTKLLSSTTAGVLATETDHPLGFDTNDQRRMTLTSTGLGIGTASPDHSLEIDGGSSTDVLHLNSTAPILKVTATNNSSGLRINAVGLTSSGHTFRVQKDGATQFAIGTGGNVGIGTNSPSQKLEVLNSANGGTIPIVVANRDVTSGTNQNVSLGFGLSRNSGTFKDRAGKIQVGRELDWTSADSNIDSFMAFYTYTNNAESEKMRILANGRVGIGTGAAAADLHVEGGGSQARLIVNSNTAQDNHVA